MAPAPEAPALRRAGIPDLASIVSLRIEFECITRDSGSFDVAARRAELESLLGPDLAGGRLRCWVAEVGGRAIAQAALRLGADPGRRWPRGKLRPQPGPEGEILNVYTAEGYRGRGIGTALVELAVAEAVCLGLSRLRLQATEESRRIYERGGFRASGRGMVLILHQGR